MALESLMNFEHLTKPVLDFVRVNQGWAPAIVGVIAFCESLAVVSLLVPATVLMLGIGALIGGAGLEFWPIWFGAAVGATLGDWVSYEISRYFGEPIKAWGPLKRYQSQMDRAEDFMRRYGVWGVVIGRFFGPLRAVVPLVAGIFHMPRVRFQAANVFSAMLWAGLMLAPGAGLTEWLQR
jgi:membrane protein DedA with SNARE-associated domain